MKKYLSIVTVFFLISIPGLVSAQQPILGPSTSIYDPKSIFANPSLLSFQRTKLAVGVKGYHMGFLDQSGIPLKQGYLTVSSPFLFLDRIGAGASVQYFDSDIFSRSFYSANVAARLFRFISVGASLSAYHISYDESEFDLVHPDDPVFAGGTSRTTLNTTFGVYAQPFEFISFALGIRNVNEPSLSLIGDAVYLDREFFAGATYTHGPFKGTLEIMNQPHGLDARMYVELFSSHGNFVRTGSHIGFDNVHIEGQMHISGPFSVNYNYELPTSGILGQSGGSHMLSLIIEFDRLPRLPDRVRPPTYQLSFEEPTIDPVIEPRIYASSNIEYLKYYEKQLIREIDDNIPDESLETLSEYDLGAIDSVFSQVQYPYEMEQLSPVPSEIEFTTTISPHYQRILDEIGLLPRVEPIHPISIVTDEDNVMKAFGIHNILRDTEPTPGDIHVGTPRFESVEDSIRYHTRIDRSTIVPFEEMILLDPDETSIRLYPVYVNPTVRQWTLIIENNENYPVKRFSGTGTIPDALTWDWHDDANTLIEPGIYSYYMRWEDADGTIRESDRRQIYVQKFLRKITIQVTQDREKLPDQLDRINLIIKN